MNKPGPHGPHKPKDAVDRQTHIRAVNRAVKDAGSKLTSADDPLVETLRVLARQMDASGYDPSTRLTTAYLQAQRELSRRLATTRTARTGGGNPVLGLRAVRDDEGREAG